MIELGPLNIAALGLFGVCWLGYQPLLYLLSRRGGAVINTDLAIVRSAWMHNMARRENRWMDGQLLGQTLSSSPFFASSNLILIAATAGVLFGGQTSFRNVSALVVVKTSSRLLFEGQLALVVLTLARGLLDFIWGIRQLNYVLAAIGATPERADDETHHAFGDAAGRLLNPALSSVNAGVRGYYFALAARPGCLGRSRSWPRRWARSPCCSGASGARPPPRPSRSFAICWRRPQSETSGPLSNPPGPARLSRDAALRVGQAGASRKDQGPCNIC